MIEEYIKKALADKLEDASGIIIDALIPKYVAEYQALLEKAANRLVKDLASNLVIEDKGSFLSVTIATPVATKGIKTT